MKSGIKEGEIKGIDTEMKAKREAISGVTGFLARSLSFYGARPHLLPLGFMRYYLSNK